MENEVKRNDVREPMIVVQEMDNNDLGLVSLVGDRNQFLRFGEFLAFMHGDHKFYYTCIDKENKPVESLEIELMPKSDTEYLGEIQNENEETNTEDMVDGENNNAQIESRD